MKKTGFKTKVLGSILTLALFLAGCQSASPQAETPATPDNPEIILATTTSTRDSGLLDVLIPLFEAESGYKIKTIAVGTGAALEMGRKGEADVLMTHAPDSEKALVDEGVVIQYTLLMHNDFVFVGPLEDPAGMKAAGKAVEALAKVAESQSLFVSRGDNSGTHMMELGLWEQAGLSPEGSWYQETGAGMGDTINIAAEKGAYTLTDRATYLNLMKNLDTLEILFEKDPVLNNIYHVMAVNHEVFDKVNQAGAEAFIAFLVEESTQKVIETYGVEEFGQPLFFPDAM